MRSISPRLECELDILEEGHLSKDPEVLEYSPDTEAGPFVWVESVNRFSLKLDVAMLTRREPRDAVKKCRFSAPVWAYHSNGLS